MIHCKLFYAAIACQRVIMEGYIKPPQQGLNELLHGYVSTILVYGKDGDPPRALAGPFQIPFGILDQI